MHKSFIQKKFQKKLFETKTIRDHGQQMLGQSKYFFLGYLGEELASKNEKKLENLA
jgi:hypothetical protein